MRIMSVIGALALACLCLASPSIAASPTDHLTFDLIGHELAAVQPVATEIAAVVDPFDLAAPLVAIASTDEPDFVACDTPDALYGGPPSGVMTSELLPACTNLRHYDPGWRFG